VVEAHQGHRVDPDQVADDEFHSREPDAVVRDAPPAEGRSGIGQVEKDLGARGRQGRQVHLGRLERQDPFVDLTLVALGARDRDFVGICERARAIARAHDGGDAQLAGDDGGVAGAAPQVGDDAGRLFHDRDPVRVGHLRHQDRAFLDLADVGGVEHPADPAGGDPLAHREAGGELPALPLETIGLQDRRPLLGLHRLRPRLDDEELSRIAVLRPF
jgi:hypothetical protein